MPVICVCLILRFYFQRKGENMGPEEIPLVDREFSGHRAAEMISIMFHLILNRFPSGL